MTGLAYYSERLSVLANKELFTCLHCTCTCSWLLDALSKSLSDRHVKIISNMFWRESWFNLFEKEPTMSAWQDKWEWVLSVTRWVSRIEKGEWAAPEIKTGHAAPALKDDATVFFMRSEISFQFQDQHLWQEYFLVASPTNRNQQVLDWREALKVMMDLLETWCQQWHDCSKGSTFSILFILTPLIFLEYIIFFSFSFLLLIFFQISLPTSTLSLCSSSHGLDHFISTIHVDVLELRLWPMTTRLMQKKSSAPKHTITIHEKLAVRWVNAYGQPDCKISGFFYAFPYYSSVTSSSLNIRGVVIRQFEIMTWSRYAIVHKYHPNPFPNQSI